MFLYEMHCHTSEGSRCASVSGEELAPLYASKGYRGVVVTDHFYGGNTAVERDQSWDRWVNGLAKGYEAMKRSGERHGLQVFFGWEFHDNGTEFLTYGLDKEWLLAHPELKNIDLEHYCEMVRKDGGILIHAHPFRQRDARKTIRLLPGLTDGVETVNKCNQPKANFLADQYAENFGLMKIGGTDLHNQSHFSTLGGVAMPFEIKEIKELFEEARKKTIRIL